MVFLLNGKPVDALALIVHRSAEQVVGHAWVKKLRKWIFTAKGSYLKLFISDKVIPRQLFEVPIQAAVGKRIIARATLSAMRADVTAGLYGGHYERKLKHLNNQKESKKKMKRVGSVDLPQEAFYDILSSKKSWPRPLISAAAQTRCISYPYSTIIIETLFILVLCSRTLFVQYLSTRCGQAIFDWIC